MVLLPSFCRRSGLSSAFLLGLAASAIFGLGSTAPTKGLGRRADSDPADGSPSSSDVSERVPDDATKPVRIVEWLVDQRIDRTKLVFYSNQDVGRPQAEAFTKANPDYKSFFDIFNEKFISDFGNVNMDDEVFRAASQAMAHYAKTEARVFNNDNAVDTSYWKQLELPILNSKFKKGQIANVFNMNDQTTDPNDHKTGNLVPIPDSISDTRVQQAIARADQTEEAISSGDENAGTGPPPAGVEEYNDKSSDGSQPSSQNPSEPSDPGSNDPSRPGSEGPGEGPSDPNKPRPPPARPPPTAPHGDKM